MKDSTLLKNLIDAIDDYNKKYNITPMDPTIEKSEEGKNWIKAYNDAKKRIRDIEAVERDKRVIG